MKTQTITSNPKLTALKERVAKRRCLRLQRLLLSEQMADTSASWKEDPLVAYYFRSTAVKAEQEAVERLEALRAIK